MKKIILPLILVFLIGTFVFAKMLSSNVNKETEAEKDLLESIQLIDMNGNDYAFSRDKNIKIKGKINFFILTSFQHSVKQLKIY